MARRRSATSASSTAVASGPTSGCAGSGPGLSASTADGADAPRLRVRAAVSGQPQSSISTGLPVLDHLISLLAEYASLDLSLEVQPGATADEVAAAGRALGEALAAQLRDPGVRGHGSSAGPAGEAPAHGAPAASGPPPGVPHVPPARGPGGGLAAARGAPV